MTNSLTTSYVSGSTEHGLIGQTIGDYFDKIANKYPDKQALISIHQESRLSYSELRTAINECARALLTLGIKKGERVGIFATNCKEWLILQIATSKIGAILVNINPSYRQQELSYALQQSGCRLLVFSESIKTTSFLQMILELIPEVKTTKTTNITSEKFSQLNFLVCINDDNSLDDISSINTWTKFIELSNQTDTDTLSRAQASLNFDDPINIQYTSGTTGFPKGATLTHHNLLNNAFFVANRMGFTEQDRLVIPVPLYHCFGMVMGNLGCISHGATIIYPDYIFDAEATLDAVQKEQATALFGVPTMFISMLEHADFEKYHLNSLRTGIMAGSPCPIEIMKKVYRKMHMPEVEIAYGMTETSPVSFQTGRHTPLDKRVSTVGLIHPHLEVKLVDTENKDQVVPIGQIGELCTRGYSIMRGYWNDPQATKAVINEAGWMHSGDLAIMDEKGYVNIVGRSTDMVIRGGENIYPREIEELLHQHPGVQDAQVIGVPDKLYGEEVMAWIILKEDYKNVTIDDLKTFCKEQVARFKVPRYIKFVDSFPMTVTGKIQKFMMRETSIKELGLEDELTA